MNIERAATRILKPHVDAMRSWAATHPMPPPPERRARPTSNFIWKRYLSSAITSLTRSTPDLREGLYADPEWLRLRREGPSGCPPVRSLRRFLAKHRIRFPAQKAVRIRRAVDRDFDGL